MTDAAPSDPRLELLFRPSRISNLELRNRIVMAPMTRTMSPGGIPRERNAAYYRRRAAGGAGLIITEGTWVPHPAAANEENVPRIYGAAALAGWREVVRSVHDGGASIFSQLWHVGQVRQEVLEGLYEAKPEDRSPKAQVGPSGIVGGFRSPLRKEADPATKEEIEAIVKAFGVGAMNAQSVGFDGVEIHAAHGYLFDQFFWKATNRRTDDYGGPMENRVRFAAETVREIRGKVGPDFPISLRLSQWKQQDFSAKLFEGPEEMESFLRPLVDAGVDAFHCSQRRFWETEFGSEHNLAAWAKRLSGKPAISVGSVGITSDHVESLLLGDVGEVRGLDDLLQAMERDDFDLIAIGRGILADPEWPIKVRRGQFSKLKRYSADLLKGLY
jgi:2,4-dienoyl-CoA reductase-like NADH-dependent reductase (Old Yellow Enzyme family)